MEIEAKAYPLDDTPYLARFLRRWNFVRTTGVVSVENNLAVVANNNMTVTLKKGQAFLNNGDGSLATWIENDIILTIDVASGTYNRIDAICGRWDIPNNKSVWTVVKGIPATNAVPPTITRTPSSYEIFLAYVSVPVGSTTITQAQVTDKRLDEAVCGLVRDGIERIPSAQFDSQMQELLDQLEQAITDVGSLVIPDNSVTTQKLANGAVTNIKIGDSAVTSSKIQDGSVTNAKIGASAVTEAKLASNAVTTVKILDKNVTTAKLADNSVTSAKLNLTDVLNYVYPIGSVYITINNVSPSSIFGGTWQIFGKGRTIVGVDTAYLDFNTVKKTGGERTHVLSAAEMPSHSHKMSVYHSGSVYGNAGGASNTTLLGSPDTTTAGSGLAHNNLQPYITAYMWERTA